MLCKNWVIPKIDKNLINDISEKFNIDPFLAMMLQVRGINTDAEILETLNESNDFCDPMSFMDMDKAVERINVAIDKFEMICVYGDYDSDGVTSTALLYLYLNMRGANVIYLVPNRECDGYGLNKKNIEELKVKGVKLIITVDNGIAAYDEVEFANSLGIDVVVTDHHKVPEKIPNAVAVVDPHRLDCPSKFKDFAGVGVVFKLVCALEGNESSIEDLLSEYGDFVAIGTIGDVVPLKGENRSLVAFGIKNIDSARRPGIKHLLDVSGISGKEITSTNVAFSIVPRINASGRINSADTAVKLLISEHDDEADSLANNLNSLNMTRKKIESQILVQVEEFLEKNPSRIFNRIIVAEGEGFHPGVIGIVASRVVEKYSKPCIIISKNGNVARGSGRSVEGFSLYDAVAVCRDYLLKFGGHPMAVGFDVSTEKINSLVDDINFFAKKFSKMPVLSLNLDCKLRPESLSTSIVDQLKTLEPFGCENPSPLFGLFGMKIDRIFPVSGGKHLRLTLSRNNTSITAMKFSTTIDNLGFVEGDVVDLAATISKDVFRNQEQLSIFIRDIKISGVSREEINSNARIYESIKNNEYTDKQKINNLVPSRNEFADVYRFIKSNGGWKSSLETLWFRLKSSSISPCKLDLIIDIMEELNLICVKKSSSCYLISLNAIEGKVDLESSPILQHIKLIGGR